MKRISNLALLALLPATAVAQRPDPKMEWEEFLTENGRGSWSVMWNPATGTPDAIYGKGLATGDELTTIEAGRVEAEALLKKYADLLGMGDSKFVELDSSKIRHLLYFNYGQRYKGLEVRGGRADVLERHRHADLRARAGADLPVDAHGCQRRRRPVGQVAFESPLA